MSHPFVIVDRAPATAERPQLVLPLRFRALKPPCQGSAACAAICLAREGPRASTSPGQFACSSWTAVNPPMRQAKTSLTKRGEQLHRPLRDCHGTEIQRYPRLLNLGPSNRKPALHQAIHSIPRRSSHQAIRGWAASLTRRPVACAAGPLILMTEMAAGGRPLDRAKIVSI
jgi:hypothetical protein